MKQDSNRAGPYFSIPHVYKTFHDEITILLRWQLVSQLPVCEKRIRRRDVLRTSCVTTKVLFRH